MITDTLITDDVWSDAPEDAQEAFLFIATEARRRLNLIVQGDESLRGQHSLANWRRQYVWELSAVADQLGIQGLPSPGVSEQNDTKLAEFDAFLARILTTIKTANRANLRADSAILSYQTKETIRSHVEGLRAKVNASNLSDATKAALHKKIDAVEAELDNKRSSLRPFWVLSGALAAAAAAGIGAMADLPEALKTANSFVALIHADKAIEERHAQQMTRPPLLEHHPQRQITDRSVSTKNIDGD